MSDFFSGVHLHLLVNHAPIFGGFFALALLTASWFMAGDVLRRTALVVLVGTALAAAAANYTGEPAEHAIEGFPGVTRADIHEHEEMAEIAFRVAVVAGILALVALVRWKRAPLPRNATILTFVAAATVSATMAYAGLLGGRVRHTEVRPGSGPADASAIEVRRAREGR